MSAAPKPNSPSARRAERRRGRRRDRFGPARSIADGDNLGNAPRRPGTKIRRDGHDPGDEGGETNSYTIIRKKTEFAQSYAAYHRVRSILLRQFALQRHSSAGNCEAPARSWSNNGEERTMRDRADDRGDGRTRRRASGWSLRDGMAGRARAARRVDERRIRALRVDKNSQFRRLPGERAVAKVAASARCRAPAGLTAISGAPRATSKDDRPADGHWRGTCMGTRN